jgi:hypothetical protein
MQRRKFVQFIGGAAMMWPAAVRAQQPAMPSIGFLHPTLMETKHASLAAFHRGLGDTGFVEGKNVAVEYRWAQGQNDRLPMLVAELVRRLQATCYFTSARKLGVGSAPMSACLDTAAAAPGVPAATPRIGGAWRVTCAVY